MNNHPISIEELEAIQQCLNGEMTTKKEREFRVQLKNNQALEKEFQWYQDIQYFFIEKEYASVKEKVKGAISALDFSSDNSGSGGNNPKVQPTANSALYSLFFKGLIWGSIVVGIIGLIVVLSSRKPDKYGVESYILPLDEQAIFQEGDFASGIKVYYEEEYEQAIVDFKRYINERSRLGESAPTASLYLASSYLLTQDYDSAAIEFKKLLDEEQESLLIQAKWYLALIYARQDKINQAIPLIQELKQDSIKITGLDSLLQKLQNEDKK